MRIAFDLAQHDRVLDTGEPRTSVHPLQHIEGVGAGHMVVGMLPAAPYPLEHHRRGRPRASRATRVGQPSPELDGPGRRDQVELERQGGRGIGPVEQEQPGSRDVGCHLVDQSAPRRVVLKAPLEHSLEELRLAEPVVDSALQDVDRVGATRATGRDGDRWSPEVRPPLSILAEPADELEQLGVVLVPAQLLGTESQGDQLGCRRVVAVRRVLVIGHPDIVEHLGASGGVRAFGRSGVRRDDGYRGGTTGPDADAETITRCFRP